MALPSKPTTASNMGEIHRDVEMVASSPTSNHGPDMGSVTTSHIGGGAVWWKSPSTALVRGRDGQPPDLLYRRPLLARYPATCGEISSLMSKMISLPSQSTIWQSSALDLP